MTFELVALETWLEFRRLSCPESKAGFLNGFEYLVLGNGSLAFIGKKILDSWWCCLNQKHIFSDVYLVTNADKYKHYEVFTSFMSPADVIISDGPQPTDSRLKILSMMGPQLLRILSVQ